MGDGPTTSGEQATALATPETLDDGAPTVAAPGTPAGDGPPTVAASPPQDAQGTGGPVGELVAGRYRIESVVGTGGMAAVYRARDEVLGRPVALKIIAPVADDPSAVKRERTEVELLASLNHHALVTLYDAGVQTIDGAERTYLVMELVDGTTLADRTADGPLGAADACWLAVDLAEALHVVHDHGVVHRDIKPGNVLVRPSHLPGRELTAKLADFGIAYLIDSTRLTVAGGLVGTAAYLSPEQAQGHPPAPASDIYSLGLVLLEALTGVRCFPGTLMESISARLVTDPVVPDEVGPAWRTLLTRMTARTPEDRPSALEVALAARAIEMELVLPAPGGPPAAGPPGDPGATAVLPALPPRSATPRQRADGALLSLAPGTDAPSDAPGDRSRRRPAVLVLVLLLLLVVGALVLVNLPDGAGSEPPTLPAVEDPLGTHLDELLQSVTP